MAANPSIANPNIIPDKEQSADREQSALEGGQLNPAGLLERAEEVLRKANFNQTPLKFQTIAAPQGADYFLNDKRPPTDPDDD